MSSPKSKSTTRKKRGPGPPKGAKNAAKPDVFRKSEVIKFRATRTELARYYSAAEASTTPLSGWIRDTLNDSIAASCDGEKK